MANYFMIYRPFHFEYAKKILRAYYPTDDTILVNHYPKDFVLDDVDAPMMTLLNLPRKRLDMIKEIKKVKGRMKASVQSGQTVNIFIPHTLGILSNYAYFKLAEKYGNARLHIFYEGIIIFYPYTHSYLKNPGYYASRWLLSSFSGISYTLNQRLLDLHSKKIDKIYTPFREIDAPMEKIVEVPLEKLSYEPRANCCVILGLRLEKQYDEEVKRIIAAMYQMIKDQNITEVYFKDHPSEKNDLFNSIAQQMDVPLTLIEDTSPIENIIHLYKPKHVISIWSSGIINLKSMLPESSLIYCFITKKIAEAPGQKQIVDVFEKQGIIIKYS